MRLVLPTLLFAAVTSCASPTMQSPSVWSGLQMDGLILDLQSSRSVEKLFFYRSGDVAATVGPRNGQLAGPVWAWRVRGAWLEIFESRARPTAFERFRALEVTESRLIAQDEKGRKLVFRISHAKA